MYLLNILQKLEGLALKEYVAMCEENSWQKNSLISLNICCVTMSHLSLNVLYVGERSGGFVIFCVLLCGGLSQLNIYQTSQNS